MNLLYAIFIILSSHVKMCWNNTSTWEIGTTQWDTIVHRYIHLGRLCIDLEEHPDPALITINIYVPRRWLKIFTK